VSVSDDLLAVQDHDTAADRLRHRRATLPELAELASVGDRLAELEVSLAEVTGRRDEVARREKRLDDDVTAVTTKMAEVKGLLYSGTVSAIRELQAMEAEVDALARRRTVLEDELFEAMEEREPLDVRIADLEDERGRLDAEGSRLHAVVAEAQAALDGELAVELDSRAKAAAGLPPELATLYEQLRARSDGVGAARLVNGRCGGCHLALPATEVDRLRRQPPDSLQRCEQCGRILVP